jgi:hypothetical protein
MVCRSKVVSSSLTINVTVIAQATIQLEHPSNRHGAEAARRAHNPEDLGSKPSVGILFLFNRGARRAEGSEGALVAPSSFPRIPLISRFPVGWRVSKRIHPVQILTNGWFVKCLFCCYFFRLNGYSLFLYLCNF